MTRDDNATVLDPALYRVDAAPRPRASPGRRPRCRRPICATSTPLAIAFTAGYGDAAADVPEPIRQAILMIVADLYAHRGDDAPTPAARWRCSHPIAWRLNAVIMLGTLNQRAIMLARKR